MALREHLRERTNLRSGLASLLVFLLGIALLIFSEGSDLISTRVWLKALVANLGGVLIASVAIAFLWEMFSKRALLDELLEKTKLAEEVRGGGLIGITLNPLRGPDFPHLIKQAQRLDIFVIYANTWRANFESELRILAKKPGARVRLIVPDTEDAELMKQLASRLGSPDGPTMKQKIEVAIAEFGGIFDVSKNEKLDYSVWLHRQTPVYSFYRFENTAVFTTYKHSLGRGDTPTFIASRGGSLYRFIEEDVDALVKGTEGQRPLARRVDLANLRKQPPNPAA